jgi:hypothetical protein
LTPRFGGLLSRLEKKPACKGRSLETFLTYPMHQVNILSREMRLMGKHRDGWKKERKMAKSERDGWMSRKRGGTVSCVGSNPGIFRTIRKWDKYAKKKRRDIRVRQNNIKK